MHKNKQKLEMYYEEEWSFISLPCNGEEEAAAYTQQNTRGSA